MSELPARVRIREVGPRDGFQNEPETIPTEHKVALIDALARTGLTRLEVTSFVRPDVIPQLADAAAVLERVEIPEAVSVSVLIPNERGLDKALALRESAGRARAAFDEINVIVSASEPRQPQERQPLDRGVAGRPGGGARPRARGRPALRGRDLDLLRLSLRGPRAACARLGDRDPPA